MRVICLLVGLVVVILAGCGRTHTQQALEQADSLLQQRRFSEAQAVLRQVGMMGLTRQSDAVYYALLSTQLDYLLYKPIETDSVINSAVDYYRHEGPLTRYVNALFYKGMVLYNYQKKPRQALVCLKEAENLAFSLHDLALSHKIYEALVVANYYSKNLGLSLAYARKSLRCSERKGNDFWLAYSYNHLAYIFDDLGMQDSAEYYIRKCIPKSKVMPPRDRSDILSALGHHYLQKGQTDKAQYYFRQAYADYPLPEVCVALSQICRQRQLRDSAQWYISQALRHCSDLQDRVSTLSSIYEIQLAEQRYEGAARVARWLMQAKDSLSAQQRTADIREIQMKYDNETTRRHYDQLLIRILYASILFIIIVALVIVRVLVKSYRAQQRIDRDQILLSEYNRQIEQLKLNGQDTERRSSQKIRMLERKINEILNRQTDQLAHGRQLLESLKQGGTVVKWTKTDVNDLIVYYKLINITFVVSFDTDYTSLSQGNRLFLILQDMGFSDADICHILGISQGAIRTTRSRIRSKKKDIRHAE